MTQMQTVRLSALAAICLLALSCAGASIAADYSQEVPLWPEDSRVLQDGIRELAEEEWALTRPTFLLYSPQVSSTRSAVLAFAGGGYKALAIGPNTTIGPNGTDVCRWLTDSGITCILLNART
ncbi:hypothetical protein [Luteimonas suaedae]|uniref:hypothetical protein n=1 Tax=Luteimonas suaedae TaxID=2605430 RepID=UPI0011F0877E|nr:hypothetical protein [Luteimonas suaedae]